MTDKSSRKRKKEKDDLSLSKLEGKKKKLEYHKEQLEKIVRGVTRGLLDVKGVENVLDDLNEYLEKNEVSIYMFMYVYICIYICVFMYMCLYKIIYFFIKMCLYLYTDVFICLYRVKTHKKKKIYMSY
jgi:uncharacterized membrane protein YjjP (DUF1212 family)